MKRRNKIFAIVLTVLVFSCLLFACNKKDEPAPTGGTIVKERLTNTTCKKNDRTTKSTSNYVSVNYCACNGIAAVRDNSSASVGTVLSRCTEEYISEDFLKEFDELSVLYSTLVENYADSSVQTRVPKEGEKTGDDYNAFFEKIQTVFASSAVEDCKKVKYTKENSLILGVNKTWDIRWKDNYSNANELLITQRLFGYLLSYSTTFKTNCNNIITAFASDKERDLGSTRTAMDGAVYTENGSFVMPYLMKNKSGKKSVVVCVFITKNKDMGIFISDILDASSMVGFGKSTVTDDPITVYGRCDLLSTQPYHYKFSLDGENLPDDAVYATIKMTVEDQSKTLTVLLLPEYAPKTVENFIAYANEGFYDGTCIHRIVKNGCLQGGEKIYDKGYKTKPVTREPIEGEFRSNAHPENIIAHCPGVISMARANDVDSATAGFFLCYEDYPSWNGQYAAFGFMPYQEDIDFVKNIGETTMISANNTPNTRVITIEEVRIFGK